MKISIACDHAGLEFKERIRDILQSLGHQVVDCGTYTKESCDYPDFGFKAARMVATGEADRAVLVCWTGNGMGMVANKVRGVRGGLALNPEMALLTRSHNDANVLIVSQKYTLESDLREILDNFLNTGFEGGRHQRRIEKMMAAENE